MSGIDDSEIAELASTLDDLAPGSQEPWTLLQKFTASLRKESEGGLEFARSETICSIERALAYSIHDDQKYYGGAVFGSAFSSVDNEWPPAYDAVPDAERKIWIEAATKLTHLLPSAHFHDLLFSAGIDATPAAGAKVVALYFKLTDEEYLDNFYRVACLRRAWSIARRFASPEEHVARQKLWSIAQKFSSEMEHPPGVLLQPFGSLVVRPRGGTFKNPSKAEVKALLESIRETRWPHAPIVEGVTELLEKLASSETERLEVRRKLVEMYLELARSHTGILASSWYDHANAAAVRYGLTDLRDQAVSARQELPLSELEMQSHFIESQVPRHLADVYLSRYRHAGDSRAALDLWLTSSSPTGDYEKNRKSAQASVQKSTLMRLVTRSTFNADGLPVRTSTGAESLEEETLERLELMSAGVFGTSLARELELIKNNYGALSAEDIVTHLVLRYECDAELAHAFGEALESFWEGRYSDVGRAAFPLVEAGARGLLLVLGDPLYRMPSDNADGRFPSLSEYTKRLEVHNFDPDWVRCLLNPVATLRNALAHGHRHQVANHEAATLLRVAGLFVTLTPPRSSAADRQEVEKRLRDPIAWAAGNAKFTQRAENIWIVESVEDIAPPSAERPF